MVSRTTSFVRHCNMLSLVLSVYLVFSTSPVYADLSCKGFYPKGSSTNRYAIEFSGQSRDLEIPGNNTIVANPIFLGNNSRVFTRFAFQTCNSISLGVSRYGYDNDCDDSGCLVEYYNYVRVITPESGDCLTARQLKNSQLTEIYPAKCNPAPTTTSQLFFTMQSVEYPNSQGGYTSYGSTSFNPFVSTTGSGDRDIESTWLVSKDNKTILYSPYTGAATPLNAVLF